MSDLLGVSGRAILRGLIEGETTPERLLARTTGLLRAEPEQLQAALEGQVREHHRFLLRLHLTQIEAIEDGLRTVDAPVLRSSSAHSRRSWSTLDHSGV